MKKIIVSLAMFVSTLSAFATEEKVSAKVLAAFNTEFNTAKDVEWTIGNSYYVASFLFNENRIFAYYDAEGDLLGLTRYISTDVLPLGLQNSLKRNYSDYWITDLFEVTKNGTTDYYITLENADKKIVLNTSGRSEWELFRKVRKD